MSTVNINTTPVFVSGDGNSTTVNAEQTAVFVGTGIGEQGPEGPLVPHNELAGRSDADAHPISAVTGLQVALDTKQASAGLAAVATSGEYSDLLNPPVIPAAQINSDWAAGAGVAEILNKPTLGTAAATDATDYATAAQGMLADSAAQPADVATAVSTHAAETSGVHGISAFGATLVDDANAAAARATLELGTAATTDASSYATAAQGLLADTATQPSDNVSTLTNDAGYQTAAQVDADVSAHAAETTGVHGISAYGATLVDDVDAAAARTTLELGTAATTAATAYDPAGAAAAAQSAAQTFATGEVATHNALTTGAHGITAAGAALTTAIDAAAQRTALALGTAAQANTGDFDAAGAAAAAQAFAIQRANHTGTQSAATVQLAENSLMLGNASNVGSALATGAKGRALLALANDAALQAEILARLVAAAVEVGSLTATGKISTSSTAGDSIETAGGVKTSGSIRATLGGLAATVTPMHYLSSDNSSDAVALEVRQGRFNKDNLVLSINQTHQAKFIRLNENGADVFSIASLGTTIIGTDPGGSELVRVGGSARINGILVPNSMRLSSSDSNINADVNSLYLSQNSTDSLAGNYLSTGHAGQLHFDKSLGDHRLRAAVSGTAGAAISWQNQFIFSGVGIAFYGGTPVAKQTITGSRGGNAALADLLTKLATIGLITDSTTA